MLGQGSFLGRRILDKVTFTGLGALEVAAPPPYVFLIGGLLSPFSNCPLLMVSSILVP